ncbi:hypothetical protein [Dongia sp.]|uniref:hypothetical protein n=1 Tax=Dongia sp. TaxID=1977262 RepID=UPI0035B3C7DD
MLAPTFHQSVTAARTSPRFILEAQRANSIHIDYRKLVIECVQKPELASLVALENLSSLDSAITIDNALDPTIRFCVRYDTVKQGTIFPLLMKVQARAKQ